MQNDVRELLVEQYGEDGLPFDTRLGDGTEFEAAEIDEVNRAYARHTRRMPWRVGDLLLVDNILSAHGREPFRGDRKIVVAMGDPVALADCSPSREPTAR